MPKSIECAHRKYETLNIHKKISRVTEYQKTQYFVLDKGNVAEVYNCFLKFPFEGKSG